MRNLLEDFKDFAVRGNVIDMAVGVVIGVAFGKIVSSFVSDVIMPPIGLMVGGVDFSDLVWVMQAAENGVAEVSMRYGVFLQTVFDFVIIAFAVFLAVKIINTTKKKLEEPAAEAAPVAPPEPSNEEKLLAEIRDLLKQR